MAFSYSIGLLKHCNAHLSNVSKLHTELLQLSSAIINSQRYYRGHKAHNIGRVHGLEKVEPPPPPKNLRGVWDPIQFQAQNSNFYDALNFTISGYDLVLVEKFAQFVHRTMIQHKQNIVEVYALPSSNVEIVRVNQANQRRLENMDMDITLTTHQRVVQVKEMQSHMLPVFLQSLMFHVPQSVRFTVKPHDEEQHAARFQKKMELEFEKENLRRLYESK